MAEPPECLFLVPVGSPYVALALQISALEGPGHRNYTQDGRLC